MTPNDGTPASPDPIQAPVALPSEAEPNRPTWSSLAPSVHHGTWTFLLSPALWVSALLLTALWYGAIHGFPWWTDGHIQPHTYPWTMWANRLWLGVLSFLLLARVLEQFFLLTGEARWPFPALEHAKHYQLHLPSATTLDWQHLMRQNQLQPTRHKQQIYWFEQGTLHAWGSWFVMLALLVMVFSVLLSACWPAFTHTARICLFCTPWLLVGILLRWTPPHRILAFAQHQDTVEIWGYSEHGWLELDREILHIQQLVLAHTASHPLDPTDEKTEG